MLRVTCPWCGAREQVEFSCHGEAGIARPADCSSLDDRGWGEYVFFKENAKGITLERWEHIHGCRRWFIALRDNVTDCFLGFSKPGEDFPQVPSSYRQALSCASIPMPRSAGGYGKNDKKVVLKR